MDFMVGRSHFSPSNQARHSVNVLRKRRPLLVVNNFSAARATIEGDFLLLLYIIFTALRRIIAKIVFPPFFHSVRRLFPYHKPLSLHSFINFLRH